MQYTWHLNNMGFCSLLEERIPELSMIGVQGYTYEAHVLRLFVTGHDWYYGACQRLCDNSIQSKALFDAVSSF